VFSPTCQPSRKSQEDPMATITTVDVISRVLAYNGDYVDEIRGYIDGATPAIDVTVYQNGTGRRVGITAAIGLRTTDGGFLRAEDPRVLSRGVDLPRWSTESMIAAAQRLVSQSYGDGHGLPVSYCTP
jgi:hypothetical protein